MFKLSDRVKQTSLTEGTGSLTLNGVFGSFEPFSVIGDGNSTYYTIENENNFEVGIGTYSATNNSLSRDIVLSSSNNDQKINLVGLSVVFCTYPSDRAVFLDEQGYFSGQGISYSGIKFPDGTIQSSALSGSGNANKIAYWDTYNSLTYNNNLTWSNNSININGSGAFSSNVNKVTDFNTMFFANFGFNNGGSSDINNWNINTLSPVNMFRMFYDNKPFNQPLGNWNVSRVTNMGQMFPYAAFDQNISGWNIASVTTLTQMRAFGGGFSTPNYDALLIGWNNNKLASSNGIANWSTTLTPTFGTSKYTAGGAAAAARAALVSYGWTITDGGTA